MDAPLALYRRYRPESFAEVIGQEHVTEPLQAALRNNRVHHAYLFSGPRGCGKTTSARILARALNCENGPTDEPCGKCRSCVDLARGGPGSVDVIEIDAASHGGVDDARDLRERAFFAPVASRYKVYIIDEAHMVTTQGFNALLKLVEEPPPHLKFVFATTEPEKVIGTIKSRTHHYPFRLVPPRVLSGYLADVCRSEGAQIDAAALPLVVRAGGGSVRDSLSVLDQLISGAGSEGVTYANASALLGFTPDTLLDEVVDAFAAEDGRTVFGVVDRVIETGQDPRRFTEDLLRRLRDLVVIAAVPDAPATGLVDAPEDQAERLVAQAARFGRSDLSRAAELVAEGLTELRGATAPRLLLELLCARVLLPGADDSTDGLLARLDRLERRMAIARAPDPAARPGSEPDAPQAAPGPASAEPESRATSTAAGAGPGGLGLVDVRRLWPDVVEATKHKRRLAWILLSQNAQVLSLDGSALTVGFNNAGARDSFVNGGNHEILRQVLIDVAGADFKVEAVVDPSARPAAPAPAPAAPVRAPAAGDPAAAVPSAAPPPPSGPPGPRATAAAQPGEAGPAEQADQAELGSAADRAAHPDDDADDDLEGADLLQQRLGASVIAEIPHE